MRRDNRIGNIIIGTLVIAAISLTALLAVGIISFEFAFDSIIVIVLGAFYVEYRFYIKDK